MWGVASDQCWQHPTAPTELWHQKLFHIFQHHNCLLDALQHLLSPDDLHALKKWWADPLTGDGNAQDAKKLAWLQIHLIGKVAHGWLGCFHIDHL